VLKKLGPAKPEPAAKPGKKKRSKKS